MLLVNLVSKPVTSLEYNPDLPLWTAPVHPLPSNVVIKRVDERDLKNYLTHVHTHEDCRYCFIEFVGSVSRT